MKKYKISLTLKIMLLCVGLVLISSLLIRFFAFQTARTTIEETVGEMALNITRSVNKSIDGDKFEELKASEDMGKDYYIQLRNELDVIKNNTGLKYLYTMRRTEDGVYYYAVDGSVIGSEGESLLGDVEEDMSDLMIASFDGQEDYEFYDSEEWGQLISGYVPIKNSAGDIIGMLGADFDAKYMVGKLNDANSKMYLAMSIILIISILIAVGFSYLIIRSIKQLQSKVQQIQHGDLTVNIDTSRGDEVGSLARSFQKMIENMSLMIHGIRDHSEIVGREVDDLNSSIDMSNRATEEITKIVTEIAHGAVKQVESVAVVENSMERVFSEIEKIIGNIDLVNSDSDLAVKDMQEASERLSSSVKQINLVNDTVETTATVMNKLEEKFREVLSFSAIVASIATRTNLLALNASIEAASAGEHGKGFAVVAGEIKNLAKQSSEASKRINELIGAVQSEINNSSEAIKSGVIQARSGVDVMSQVEHYLERLSKSNKKIDIRIKEIAKAIIHIEEDSKNVLDKTTLLSEISKELSSSTQQTAAETEEQYAIMEGIKNDLMGVKDQMEQLGGMVNKFKIN